VSGGRRDLLRWLGPWAALAGALLLVAGVRWLGHLQVDLRDVPGPASAQFVMLAETGRFYNWTIWLLAAFRDHSGLDPVTSAQTLMLLAGVLASAGAMMGGGALAGWRGALGAAAVAALWSPFLLTSLLVGADAPATAGAWFGVGLCLLAGRTRWAGLPMSFGGALLALLTLGVKQVALPAVVMLALAPLVGGRRWPWRLAHTACLLAGAWLGYDLVTGYHQMDTAAAVHRPELATIWQGWQQVLQLRAGKGDSGALPDLLLLAVLGAALPPYRRGWIRAIALAIGILAIGISAAAIANLTSRQLVAAGLGLVVLSGVLLGNAARLLGRLGPLRWLPLVVAMILLGLDSLALIHAWSDQRSLVVGTEPAALPRPPAPWQWRHQPPGYDATTSTVGAVELMRLAREAPAGGIASPPIPDRREAHLELAAVLADKPVLIPRPEECCTGGGGVSGCAEQVVSALDEAGATLVLPVHDERGGYDRHRLDDRYREWVVALEAAALRRGMFEPATEHWRVWTGQGSGGALPCPRYAKLYLETAEPAGERRAPPPAVNAPRAPPPSPGRRSP
jgi:hypothetical protein